ERLAVHALQDERGARGVPRGVAARFERGAQAARGEARGVRLALDQDLARELVDRRAVGRVADERVVLFGRRTGHRMELVRVVRRALGDGPLLHRARDRVGVRAIELLALLDGLLERGEDVLAVQFADRRLRRIDRGLDVLRRGDRPDRLLTRVTGNHQHISSNYSKSPSIQGDMILIAGSKATKTPSRRPFTPPVPRPGTMFRKSLFRTRGQTVPRWIGG